MIFFKRFFILFYQLPTQLPPTPLYLPHRGGNLPYGRKGKAVSEPRLFFLFTADTVRSALSQSRYG